MRYSDPKLLSFLQKELADRGGLEFERFVAGLLSKKYGTTKWPPRNGSDGKIDFASKDYLFQIYGSESLRGSLRYMQEKLSEVPNMIETARANGLTASSVVFLTNIHPDKKMATLILDSQRKGIEIKDVYRTAELLYEVYYPFRQLEEYCKQKCQVFGKEDWPYDIDVRSFVENFDFSYGRVLLMDGKSDARGGCLSFVSKSILSGPVICAGYYGIGKTTISKMLFKKWDSSESSVYPVYIALTHRRLEDFYETDLGKQIVNEVKLCVFKHSPEHKGEESVEVFDEEEFTKNIYRMIENQKILVVFDGIDESASEGRGLLQFLRFIFTNKFLVFLTCRLEYRPFFDACQALGTDKQPHTYIELCEWKTPQWDKYIAGLLSAYPLKRDQISSFAMKLKSGVYSTLPGRPLFLKMLADLEISNETGISIMPELSQNLAEVYFKFIKWKVRDDYNRKGGVYDFDSREFERECFHVLREVALLEYQSALKRSESGVTLKSIQEICSENGFVELNEEYISKVLLRSGLFAILRRTEDDTFTFSHKSFMEYLVAFTLACCLFPENGNPSGARCDNAWRYFQTHEISRHFVNEVERIRVTRKLSHQKSNEFILNAFNQIVNEQNAASLRNYDERFQEVLYYIGKMNIRTPELVSTLQEIVNNKDQYHPVYFRSASLSLSRIMGDQYCEKYVLHLIDDQKGKENDFKLNQGIQRRYYGEATLRRVLKEDIDQYIRRENSSSIISLKILTYFTAISTKHEEADSLKDYLDQVYNAAVEQGHTNIQTICKAVSEILDTQNASG